MEARIVIPKSKSSAIKARMENYGSNIVNAIKVEAQESVVLNHGDGPSHNDHSLPGHDKDNP